MIMTKNQKTIKKENLDLKKKTRKKEKEAQLKEPVKEAVKKATVKKEKYIETVGRRKTSIAIIHLFTKGEKAFLVNKRPYNVYFPTLELQKIVLSALEKMKCIDKFSLDVLVRGGGLHSQAEAVRHGIARALVIFNPDFRKRLKKAGFLTRDPRMRERKKFGLKRARRAPQWQKR